MILEKVEAPPIVNPLGLVVGGIKFLVFVTIMMAFIIHHSVAGVLIWSEETRLKYFIRSIALTSKLCLRVLNIKVNLSGARGEVTQRLIVANHLSYLDVLILFSLYPSLFITSVEIRETPILGRICQLAGCFFVERRKEKRNEETKKLELTSMKQKFSKGYNIVLFPEGTSSDGSGVLPFKNTFFQLAVDTGTKVVPLCLKYTGQNSQVIPWYGAMTFPDHLFKVCMQKEISAKLIILPEISGDDKILLSLQAQKLISEAYANH